MGCDHRACRAIVDDEMQQFRSRIVANGIHHPLALEDQAHVEIGNQDAFALGDRGGQMFAFGRDDRRHATATQRLLQPFVRRDRPDLLVA